MTKAALGIAAGICGTLIIGYCIYFDRKRRSDPEFKKKLREKRKARKAKVSGKVSDPFPNLLDHEAVQQFFLEQVQKGELLLGQGIVDEGIEHLANAIAVCGQPTHLLEVLQQTLPPNVFQMLIQRLPALSKKIMKQQNCGEGSMTEDDVE